MKVVTDIPYWALYEVDRLKWKPETFGQPRLGITNPVQLMDKEESRKQHGYRYVVREDRTTEMTTIKGNTAYDFLRFNKSLTPTDLYTLDK